jgi:hypothetical protein
LRILGQSHALARMPAILISRGHWHPPLPLALPAPKFPSTELVPPTTSGGTVRAMIRVAPRRSSRARPAKSVRSNLPAIDLEEHDPRVHEGYLATAA